MPPNPRDQLGVNDPVPLERVRDVIAAALRPLATDLVFPAHRVHAAAQVLERLEYFKLLAGDVEGQQPARFIVPPSAPRTPPAPAPRVTLGPKMAPPVSLRMDTLVKADAGDLPPPNGVYEAMQAHVLSVAHRHLDWLAERLAEVPAGAVLCVHEEARDEPSAAPAYGRLVSSLWRSHTLAKGEDCPRGGTRTQYTMRPPVTAADIGLVCRALRCICPPGRGHRHPRWQEWLDAGSPGLGEG